MAGMECKLCSKKFSNGKALGGHMRSHYATLPLPPKTPQRQQELTESLTTELTTLSSDERESSSSGDGDGENNKSSLSVSYVLREKPKKSFRLVDPEFFDEISEAESTRGRWKRTLAELEMEGEEDVALCLIMLSKDVWGSSTESRTSRKVFKCEKCDKVFKSSQGLGSHRASHFKKIKNEISENQFRKSVVKDQVYECPFCERIFKSAQAFGGHKRSHYLGSKLHENLKVVGGGNLVEINGGDDKFEDAAAIDLNLPAAMGVEDDEDDDEYFC